MYLVRLDPRAFPGKIMTVNSLGDKISLLLQDSGLRQSDLSKILGVTRASVNSWILGRHSPSSEKLKQIADLFKIHLSWFRNNKADYPPDRQYLVDVKLVDDSNHSKVIKKVPFREEEVQAVEAISKNLFRVNNHDLQMLLSELQQITKENDSQKVLNLFGKFFKFIEKETGKKNIKVHYLRRRGASQ